jgi:outer membrane protein OmpA-like peptidoglycan-associated protein
LTSTIRGDTLNRIASALGESPAKTETALGAVLPALMGGLASKASTPAGADDLLDQIRLNQLDSPQYSDVTAAVKAPAGMMGLVNAGRPMLDTVLGGRTSSVAEWISSVAGVNRSSSTSLLTMALPLLVGQMARLVGGSGLKASSLQGLLSEQRSFLSEMPLGLTAALGFADAGRGSVVGTYEPPRAVSTQGARAVGTYEPETSGRSAWWKWALPLALLALIPLYFALRRPAPQQAVVQPPVRAELPGGRLPAAPAIAALGDFVEKRLPRGITLRVPSRGVEAQLIDFIGDPQRTADRETWFSFDRLEFETDSAVLKPASREQIGNVAQILTAYPNVHVKIGGYTDNVGDDAYNLKLSADRANNTLNEIASFGIDRSRLEAEGYGENHPIADNATAEGRQRNRRIDIRVTKK